VLLVGVLVDLNAEQEGCSGTSVTASMGCSLRECGTCPVLNSQAGNDGDRCMLLLLGTVQAYSSASSFPSMTGSKAARYAKRSRLLGQAAAAAARLLAAG
jgi:hypothetical protein